MNVIDGLKQAAITLRAADKIPEYNAILDAQQRIFDLQNEVQSLKDELNKVKSIENLRLEPGHIWMIDPNDPDHKLCPTCSQRLRIKQPLRGNVCLNCRGHFS